MESWFSVWVFIVFDWINIPFSKNSYDFTKVDLGNSESWSDLPLQIPEFTLLSIRETTGFETIETSK